MLLFALVFAAQHFDARGNLRRALALLDEAIEQTPTMLDLYKLNAKVFKHGGDFTTATLLLNRAREMDLQDRYIIT